ncbi:MAG: hypothetical protein ACM3MM_05000, partial [Acidobacteriota bacterium]
LGPLPSRRPDELASQAQRLGAAGLVRGIELLGSALSEMRHAPDPRVLLDVAAVQLTADDAGGDVGALLARLERLERQVAAGVAPAPEPPPTPPVDPATGRAALGGRARSAPTVTPAPAVAPPGDAATSTVDASPSTIEASPSPPTASPLTADVWENTIRPALRGMARAVYGPATFVRSSDSTLTLSVPNAVHRRKCEEQRSTVEAALGAHVGRPVTVELLDGGGSGGGPDDGGGRDGVDRDGAATGGSRGRGPVVTSEAAVGVDPVAEARDHAPVELPDDDDVDLDDLVDAPPETVKSPIDRLAEAFPGSELIEEAG